MSRTIRNREGRLIRAQLVIAFLFVGCALGTAIINWPSAINILITLTASVNVLITLSIYRRSKTIGHATSANPTPSPAGD